MPEYMHMIRILNDDMKCLSVLFRNQDKTRPAWSETIEEFRSPFRTSGPTIIPGLQKELISDSRIWLLSMIRKKRPVIMHAVSIISRQCRAIDPSTLCYGKRSYKYFLGFMYPTTNRVFDCKESTDIKFFSKFGFLTV